MQAVAVPARIAVDNAVQVLAALREATHGVNGDPLALDLAPLREFDSSALSLLLQLTRDRGAAAGSVTSAAPPLFLLNPPEKLRELADLYGVAPMLFGGPDGPADRPLPA
jgi:ABC-type transporter Mla MlaB component